MAWLWIQQQQQNQYKKNQICTHLCIQVEKAEVALPQVHQQTNENKYTLQVSPIHNSHSDHSPQSEMIAVYTTKHQSILAV